MNVKAYLWSLVLIYKAMLILSQVSISPQPSTQNIPLGKSVVLVCKAPGESRSTLSYQWSCPGGNCDASMNAHEAARSRIVNKNTLTVNVVSESDAGEYNCTVTGDGTSQTASYTLDVERGIVMSRQEFRTPLAMYSNGSVITNTRDVASGFYQVAVKCKGNEGRQGKWFGPDGSKISEVSHDDVIQYKGELLVGSLSNGTYSNGNYKCRIGNQEVLLGLYFTSNRGHIVGKYFRNVRGLQSTQNSSSSARLSWNPLTRPISVTTVGYFVSYGMVGHDVVEHVVVEGGSTTSVDLTNLQPGVECEATVRGFSQDGMVSLSSEPKLWLLIDSVVSLRSNGRIVVRWTEAEELFYKCAVNGKPVVSCTSPLVLREPSNEDTFVTVSAWRSGEGKQVGAANHVVEQKCKASMVSPIQRMYLPDGRVQLRWTASDSVDMFSCKLDDGPAVPCMSGVVYDANSLYAGKHTVEVKAYCGSTRLGRKESLRLRPFISLSGIPKDPLRCSRLVVEGVQAVYDRASQSVNVKFDTNIPAKCTCQLTTASKQKARKNCDLSTKFENIEANVTQSYSPTLTVTCTSSSCDDLRHSVQSHLLHK